MLDPPHPTNPNANRNQSPIYLFFVSSCQFFLPSVGSDDSDDSDFKKEASESEESAISEALSESEGGGKRRKTR